MKIEKITSFEVQTSDDYLPGKSFFDKVIESADYCNVYEKHANVSVPLKPNTTYLLEVYRVLEDLSIRSIDEILKQQNAIKSGSQALLLAFEQKKDFLPAGSHIVSPEEKEILPLDEHGYRRHMGLVRLGSHFAFDNGEASSIRKGDYLMVTKEVA